MRIALFIDTVAFAGTERHVLDLGQSLVAAGAAVIIACPAASPLTPRCTAAGLPVLDVPSSLRQAMRTVAILAAELRAGRVEIIHAHNGRTHLLSVAAVKRAGRGRVVATQHFLAPNRTGRSGPKAWLANQLHRWAERNTAAFIAISNAVKDQMLLRGDAPAEKITVVHNGTGEPEATTPERIAALRVELAVGDRPMVFCAARLQKEKDIPTLIKAFAALRFNDQRTMNNDQKPVNNEQRSTNDDPQITQISQIKRLAGQPAGPVTDNEFQKTLNEAQRNGREKPESGIQKQEGDVDATENESAALPQPSNSYLLTPNFFPRLLIAGEGDQRAECERLIDSRITDHGSRINDDGGTALCSMSNEQRSMNNTAKELGVRSEELEDAAKNSEARIQNPEGNMDAAPRSMGVPPMSAHGQDAHATENESAALPQVLISDQCSMVSENDPQITQISQINDRATGDLPQRHKDTKNDGGRRATEITENAENLGDGGETATNNTAKELGVRSEELEDAAKNSEARIQKQEGDVDAAPRSMGVPPMRAHGQDAHATENESAALPQPSNSYLLTSNSSQRDAGGITLLGFRSDVSALMSACDIFVLPCPVEGFGLVLLEAMALGKPVIAAAAGGPLEIVADGETGLLFEPGNAASLAQAIKRLLADPELRQRMGKAGRERYEQHFTAGRMAGGVLEAYAAKPREVRS